jgi:ADP-dependent NAD(P)H-hydrate dehydratase / NAD(P)H-hydrate epimerase
MMVAMDNKLYDISQIRVLEKLAIEQLKLSELTLMERAGEAVFNTLRTFWPAAKKIVVICGPGNNGGDGYVFAKLGHEDGLTIGVRTVGDTASYSKAAMETMEACKQAGLTIIPFNPQEVFVADMIVDAILGIGLRRTVEGVYKEAIDTINRSKLSVLSIDIPSGIDADSGRILGTAVKADVTLTFIGIKQGLLTHDAVDHCGKIILDDLGLPNAIYDHLIPKGESLTPSLIKRQLPKRRKNVNKGNFGHVLIVGGNKGMAGAVRLAAEAALRVGAGLVSVATWPSHQALILANHPEIMCHGVESSEDLIPLLARATVVLIGPGLGSDEWGKKMLLRILETTLPKVIDADALNLLGFEPNCQNNWILTPHPGEAARLLGYHSAEGIQSDRFTAITKLAGLGGIWVLKGAGTLIKKGRSELYSKQLNFRLGVEKRAPGVDTLVHEEASDENNNAENSSAKSIFLCPFGNPGMASGGMGDALTGIIGGLIAQDFTTLLEATILGVLVHALAGDRAAKEGERGLLATDLISNLRTIVN